MKALVTGGAGFIGSHVVDRLLSEGYKVAAVDNLSEGHVDNLAHLKHDKRFRFVKLDLRDAKATEKIVAGREVIFHMAAQANIRNVDSKGRAPEVYKTKPEWPVSVEMTTERVRKTGGGGAGAGIRQVGNKCSSEGSRGHEGNPAEGRQLPPWRGDDDQHDADDDIEPTLPGGEGRANLRQHLLQPRERFRSRSCQDHARDNTVTEDTWRDGTNDMERQDARGHRIDLCDWDKHRDDYPEGDTPGGIPPEKEETIKEFDNAWREFVAKSNLVLPRKEVLRIHNP